MFVISEELTGNRPNLMDKNGSNLTEGCWIVSVQINTEMAALNATPIYRTARSMKHGLKMAPVVA
jgi:hypothetical protein